jgi:hypothetical protein
MTLFFRHEEQLRTDNDRVGARTVPRDTGIFISVDFLSLWLSFMSSQMLSHGYCGTMNSIYIILIHLIMIFKCIPLSQLPCYV